jgi:hypothetical protein
MVSCGGAITSAVKGLPFELTNIAPREMSVFPVSHSAIIAPAEFSTSQRFEIPAIASACAW